MFFCKFCKIFKNISWQNTSVMTASCDYLWILRCFSIHQFYGTTLRNSSFHAQVVEFQPADSVKNYFTGVFQAFFSRTRGSQSKAFIFLKSLKIVCEEVHSQCSCEMPTCKFTKKTLSHILLRVFCPHFLRTHHDYFFWRDFGSVWAQFLSGNLSEK